MAGLELKVLKVPLFVNLRFWVGVPPPPPLPPVECLPAKAKSLIRCQQAKMELLRSNQIRLDSFSRVELPRSSKLVNIGQAGWLGSGQG